MSYLPLALKIGPWIIAALAIGFGLLERSAYEGEKAAFAAYRETEARAVLAAQQKAEALSNELVIAQATSMAVTEKTVTVYVDRIVHDTPPPPSCPPSAAARDASRGMRAIVQPDAGSAPAQ